MVGLAYLSVRDSSLASITVTDDDLLVRARGLNTLWALRRSVKVARSNIVSVSVDVPRTTAPSGIRAPGTGIPRLTLSFALETLGQLKLGAGDAVAAVRLLAAAQDHRTASWMDVPAAYRRFDALVADARAAAGAAADAAWTEGAGLDAAAAFALLES